MSKEADVALEARKLGPAQGLAQSVAPDGEGRRTPAGIFERLGRAPELGAAGALVLLYGFFVIAAHGNQFVSLDGTASWLTSAAQLGIIAVPVGLLLIAGDFDLSIGSMVGAGSVTIGVVYGHLGSSLPLAITIAAAIGLLVGLGNGLLVTRTGLPSFIVTLAANLIVAGLSLAIPMALTGTTQIALTQESELANVFTGSLGEFSVSVVWWLAILLLAAWILSRARFGNWIFATGGDVERARRAGVPTVRVKVALFVCTALAATLVGVMQALQFSTGDGTTGQGYVFAAPIVVVIGGVLLTGGYGSVLGIALGTLIYGVVTSGLFYTGWNTNYAQVVIGVLMVLAVLTNNYIRAAVVRSFRAAGGGS